MSRTVRRLGRVLFGLAGAGSALFVHLLPPPGDTGDERLPTGTPAAVASPGPEDRPLVAVPAARPHAVEPTEPPAPAVLATDGTPAAPPATAPASRRR